MEETIETRKPHEVIRDLLLWEKGDELDMRSLFGSGIYYYESIDDDGNLYFSVGESVSVGFSADYGDRQGQIFDINIFDKYERRFHFGGNWGDKFIFQVIKNKNALVRKCSDYQKFLNDVKKAYDNIKNN